MLIDLTSQSFGRLTVLNRAGSDKHGSATWFCRCECGSSGVFNGPALRRGRTNSCGCLQKELAQEKGKLPHGEASIRMMFNKYKDSAKRRGHRFEITKDEFRKITSQNCYYCGREPQPLPLKNKQNGAYISNGIDRFDNSIGYTIDNCVPCCKFCNFAKRDVSISEFNAWIDDLISNRKIRWNVAQ